MTLRHDTATAIAFLAQLCPSGPWHLTAIRADPRPNEQPITHTFWPGESARVGAFLTTYAGENIYYTLNTLGRDVANRKASEADVVVVPWLHVDIDPRSRPTPWTEADLTEEVARIRGTLEAPEGAPRPTIAVFSGGGIQALWRLEDPITIDGDTARDTARRHNLYLEAALGGDHCHNLDRILRLPGTVNWPKEAKRKRGRVPALSRVLWFDDTRYPRSAFRLAAAVQGPASGPSRPKATAPGNVRRLANVDELGDRVKDVTKMLIVNGRDVVNGTAPDSRSEVLWRVVCDLVRAELTDEEIFAIITDPDFRISDSVLDKGSQSTRYALRQIDRAREHAVDPWLATLNEKFTVISNFGGKCRVIEEAYDWFGRGENKQRRARLTHVSFDDFRNRFLNQFITVAQVEGKEIQKPVGDWWLRHPKRQQCDMVTFSPSGDVEGAYNLWRGFDVPALPGHNHEPWLAHVRDNVCSGNEEHYRYLLGWMARCVQEPDGPGEVAIVLRGRMGTGKSRFATTFGRLWGRHFLHVGDSKHLVGSFNVHLRDCVVLFGDEAFYAGDKRHESVLKTLVTEELIMIEGKGVDAIPSPNFVHLILASNSDWVVPAGQDERRYFVLDVGDARKQDHAYHGAYVAALEDGGYSHLLHYLQGYDLSGFEVRRPPRTAALVEQKQLSFTSEQEWWFHHLQDGVLSRGHLRWTDPIPRDVIVDDYLRYAQQVGAARRSTATSLGRFLHKTIPRLRGGQRLRSIRNEVGVKIETRSYYYQFPPLDECRASFDARCGGPYEWQEVGDGDTAVARAHDELF